MNKSSGHDSLCPTKHNDDPDYDRLIRQDQNWFCFCEHNAKVRADEREKALDWRVGVEVRQILEGRIYADLRAKVGELPAATVVAGVWLGNPPDETDWDRPVVFRDDILALFPEEKP